jgi:hypothetical protein
LGFEPRLEWCLYVITHGLAEWGILPMTKHFLNRKTVKVEGKGDMNKGHYQVKNLPDGVKECWFYTGKTSSIHIVLKDLQADTVINGIKYKFAVPIKQINMDLPSISKMKV